MYTKVHEYSKLLVVDKNERRRCSYVNKAEIMNKNLPINIDLTVSV